MSTIANRKHEYRRDGALVLSSDVIIEHPFTSRALDTGKPITCLQASPCGEYIAVGDQLGFVAVRSTSNLRHQLLSCNVGKAQVSALAWHQSRPDTLFVASANGHVNAVQFDVDFQNPRNTAAVKVTGLVTALKLNPTGTQIAISFGYNVSIFGLPFKDLKTVQRLTALPAEHSSSRINIERMSLDNWRSIPVKTHPRPLGLEYIGDHELCIAYFTKFDVYDTSSQGEIPLLYTVMAPEQSAIGSFAVSPNGEYLVATNIKTGIDWYSTRMKQHISSTAIKDSYTRRSFIMPVAFLTESTVVCGHHRGFLTVAQHGHDKPRVLGEISDTPVHFVSVAVTASIMLICVAVGKDLVVHPLPLTTPRTQPPSGVNPQLPSPTPSRNASATGGEVAADPPSRPRTPSTPKSEVATPDTPSPPHRRQLKSTKDENGSGQGGASGPAPSFALPPPAVPTPATGPDGNADSQEPAPLPPRDPVVHPEDLESRLRLRALLLGLPPLGPAGPLPPPPAQPAALLTMSLALWKWNPKAIVAGAFAFLLLFSITLKGIRGGARLVNGYHGFRSAVGPSEAWNHGSTPTASPGTYVAGEGEQEGDGYGDDESDGDDAGVDDGAGGFGEDVEAGYGQLVLTETKVVTVTKPVTKVATKTVTETMFSTVTIHNKHGKARRPQKAHRTQGTK